MSDLENTFKNTWDKVDNTLSQLHLVLESPELPELDKALLSVFCNQWERKKAADLAELEAFEAEVWEVCVKHPHIVEQLTVEARD